MMFQDLQSVEHVALDLDGTVYQGKRLCPGARKLIEVLQDLNLGYTFVTNNSSRSVEETLRHLHALGLEATPDQVMTSSCAAREYLRLHHPVVNRLFMLGTPSTQNEWRRDGFDLVEQPDDGEPEAVVVGFDQTLTYDRLCRAAYWIKQGKTYVATHPDRYCPAEDGQVLVDCGAIYGCLRICTGRRPDAVVGKPEPFMLRKLLAQHGLQSRQLVMIGDRLSTDIASAQRVGALSVLVLTGDCSADDVSRSRYRPDLVVPTLDILADLWMQVRQPA